VAQRIDEQEGEIQEHHAGWEQNHLKLEKASLADCSRHVHVHVQNSYHSSFDDHETFDLHFEAYGRHHANPRRSHHFCVWKVAGDDLVNFLENDLYS
jgi:hypothetical protein